MHGFRNSLKWFHCITTRFPWVSYKQSTTSLLITHYFIVYYYLLFQKVASCLTGDMGRQTASGIFTELFISWYTVPCMPRTSTNNRRSFISILNSALHSNLSLCSRKNLRYSYTETLNYRFVCWKLIWLSLITFLFSIKNFSTSVYYWQFYRNSFVLLQIFFVGSSFSVVALDNFYFTNGTIFLYIAFLIPSIFILLLVNCWQ